MTGQQYLPTRRHRRRTLASLALVALAACSTATAQRSAPAAPPADTDTETETVVAASEDTTADSNLDSTGGSTDDSTEDSTGDSTDDSTGEPGTTAPDSADAQPPDTGDPAPDHTIGATVETVRAPIVDLTLPELSNVFAFLAPGNDAVEISVWRDHEPLFAMASGTGASGQPITSDTPLVLASVSKLITALTVARLAEYGAIDLDAPMPWDLIALPHDPGWSSVTPRELLEHRGGMPKAQQLWINHPGACSVPLGEVLLFPPAASRGKWVYSNGNYCALGLLIEAVTGARLDDVATLTIFQPLGIDGPHLTTDGLLPGDGPYREGVARLERLGGAGTWMASADDVVRVLDGVTVDDHNVLQYPMIFTDQYGWGHTGTIDGAKSCAWVMEGGRTVVTAIVAGNKPSTGGGVCDAVIPALATDLGIWADTPRRIPD